MHPQAPVRLFHEDEVGFVQPAYLFHGAATHRKTRPHQGIHVKGALDTPFLTGIFARKIIHSETPLILLTCDPQDWDGQMDTVMSPRPPIWMPRWHFVCRKVNFDWQSSLPEGFSVHPLHVGMLVQDDLDLPGDVRTTLEKWAATGNDDFSDFGFVTIDENEEKPVITGWATVDFVANGRGDLGFFTQPDYRRKGLGTVAAAAALEHGLTNGLTQINWTCDAGNQGSIGTASKLGVERIEDYQMAMLVFDEGEHMGNLGYFSFQAQDYDQSARSFERALELNPESPNFIYYEAAQATAMAGNARKALDFLAEALQRGWEDVDHTRECEAFISLHALPEWGELIREMESAAL